MATPGRPMLSSGGESMKKNKPVVVLVDLRPDQLEAVNAAALSCGKDTEWVIRQATRRMLKKLRRKR